MPHDARVLIVDDNPADLLIAGEVLRSARRKRPYGLLQARSLAEAEATLRVTHVSLMLLDLGLGATEGVDTVRAARNLVADTPIVVITDNGDDARGPECIDAGADDFLPKDNIKADLVRVVEFALRRRRLIERRMEDLVRDLLAADMKQEEGTAAAATLRAQVAELSRAFFDPRRRATAVRQLDTIARRLADRAVAPRELFRTAVLEDGASDWVRTTFFGVLAAHLAQAYFESSR